MWFLGGDSEGSEAITYPVDESSPLLPLKMRDSNWRSQGWGGGATASSAAANLTTSTLRLDKRYWEKVATTQDNGQRVTQYKVFVTVKMPEADFKRSVMDAIHKQQGKGGIGEDFAKKVDQHWDRFTGNATRESASEQ